MRNRLIELIKQAKKQTKKANCDIERNMIFADYLLANGVIVPPCGVGDIVYQVTRDFISEFRVRFVEISICDNLFLHTDLISGILFTGDVFPISEIGKTVFITREEAERALKGGVKE